MAKLLKKGIVTDVAGLTLGAVGANYVKRFVPIQNEKVKAAAPIVLGIVLVSKGKGMIAKVGEGMIAAGGSALASSFGIGNITDSDIEGILDDEVEMGALTDGEIIHGMDEAIHGTDEYPTDY